MIAKKYFKQLQSIADENNIEFKCYFRRQNDCGELCFDYNNADGFILFSYDRNTETYYFSTHSFEEYKYVLFQKLCKYMGYQYELRNRKEENKQSDDNDLNSDTRKEAFEHTLMLLNKIDPTWVVKAYPKYVKLLNLWREDKNVQFCLKDLKFIIKG